MPTGRKRNESDEPPKRGKPAAGGEGTEGGEKRRSPRRRFGPENPDADPVGIHRGYVERHLEGGGPATPEAYERALGQWHGLPGSVSRPPAEALEHPPPPPETPEDEEEDEGRDAEPGH
jgi:hypothetical protein